MSGPPCLRRAVQYASIAGPSRLPLACARQRVARSHSRAVHTTAARAQEQQRKKAKETRYNFNTSLSFAEETDPDHWKYRKVTAKDLARRHEPPTRAKMLVRDFIDDSLYNPQYGYFSKQAEVFSTSTSPDDPLLSNTGLDIPAFPNLTAFQEAIADQYVRSYARRAKGKEVERAGAAGAGAVEKVGPDEGGLGRQVWHTPTELFKPHYAHIICRALLSHYLLHQYPYSDFHIYEIGAGNGSLMASIMEFLHDNYPDVFVRTRYTIVEISGALAARQRQRVKALEERGDEWKDKVKIEQSDFFEWNGGGRESCYFVALEVFDNFAHDMIRYDMKTLEPLQASVCIDPSGDFSLLYEPITDPVIRRYLGYRRLLNPTPASTASLVPPINPLLLASPTLRKLYASMPFAPNLSRPEFIPTKQMLFLERLRDRLPFHKLLVADFDQLPDAVEGRDGPVVQTRYGGSMVPCETFLVKQGFFDIFFPTDFEKLRDIYSLIMNSSSRRLSPSFFSSSAEAAGTPLRKRARRHQHAQASDQTDGRLDLVGGRGIRQASAQVYGHAQFLEEFGTDEDLGGTRTRDGNNVMLGMYKNAKVFF